MTAKRLTPKEKVLRAKNMVVRAVGRLYRSNPPVQSFTLRRKRGGPWRCEGPKWYRNPWMTEMLQAYAKLEDVRRLR